MCFRGLNRWELFAGFVVGMSLVAAGSAFPAGVPGHLGGGERSFLFSGPEIVNANEPIGGPSNIPGGAVAMSSTSVFPVSAILPRPLPFVAIGSADTEPAAEGWESTVRTPSVPELLNPEPAFPDLETTRELGTSLGVTDQVIWRVISVGCFMPSRYNFMAEPDWCASIYYNLFRCASCILLGYVIV